MTLGQMTIEKMTIGQMTIGQMGKGETSLQRQLAHRKRKETMNNKKKILSKYFICLQWGII